MKPWKSDVSGSCPSMQLAWESQGSLEAPMNFHAVGERRLQFDRKNLPRTVSGVTASAAL
jgi:hypothetical protein